MTLDTNMFASCQFAGSLETRLFLVSSQRVPVHNAYATPIFLTPSRPEPPPVCRTAAHAFVFLPRRNQGFHDPTPIQRRVLPKAVLGRKDIIGAAETGSGKTLAFGLPVLSEILTRQNADAAAAAASEAETKAVVGGAVGGGGGDGEAGEDEEEKDGVGEGLQALVLCPTRELALQVAAHLREVVRDTGLAVVVSYGRSWMLFVSVVCFFIVVRAVSVVAEILK